MTEVNKWLKEGVDQWMSFIETDSDLDDESYVELYMSKVAQLKGHPMSALFPFEETKHRISLFKCMKNSTVVKNQYIESILREILTGGENKQLILEARAAGKNSPRYEEIKYSLPTWTPNGTFKDRRHGSNLDQISGLLYLDVDGITTIDLKHPLIYACWRSLSYTGLGILVKTKGLSPMNIKEAYKEVSRELGIPEEYLDFQCAEISRQNVISYDDEIYINMKSSIYEVKEEYIKINTPTPVPSKNKKNKVWERNRGKEALDFKWDNFDTYDLGGDPYHIFEEPIGFSTCFIPQRIKNGRREKAITATATQVLALNPDHPEEKIDRLIDILNDRCEEPLPNHEVESIKNKIKKRRQSGEIQLIPNKDRYVMFSESVPTKQKQQIGAQVAGRNRQRKTIQRIKDCLNEWDINSGLKATNKEIAEAAKLSIGTVERYSKQFKEQKARINKNVKEEIERKKKKS